MTSPLGWAAFVSGQLLDIFNAVEGKPAVEEEIQNNDLSEARGLLLRKLLDLIRVRNRRRIYDMFV